MPSAQCEPPVHVDVNHVHGGSLALAGRELIVDAGLLGRQARIWSTSGPNARGAFWLSADPADPRISRKIASDLVRLLAEEVIPGPFGVAAIHAGAVPPDKHRHVSGRGFRLTEDREHLIPDEGIVIRARRGCDPALEVQRP